MHFGYHLTFCSTDEEKQAINIYVSIKEYVSKTDAPKAFIPLKLQEYISPSSITLL
jgi:hypothetical protein